MTPKQEQELIDQFREIMEQNEIHHLEFDWFGGGVKLWFNGLQGLIIEKK